MSQVFSTAWPSAARADRSAPAMICCSQHRRVAGDADAPDGLAALRFRVGRHRTAGPLSPPRITLELQRRSGARHDGADQFIPAGDRAAVDCENLVALAEAGALSRAAGCTSPDDRGRVTGKSDRCRKSLSRSAAVRARQVERRNAICAFCVLHFELDGAASRQRARAAPSARPARWPPADRRSRTIVRRGRVWPAPPACPAAGSPTIGLTPGTPCMNSTQYTHDREQEIGHGPASTMAKRRNTDCRLKARSRSSGATSPFALVEHLDVAAQRERRNRPLGLIGSELAAP